MTILTNGRLENVNLNNELEILKKVFLVKSDVAKYKNNFCFQNNYQLSLNMDQLKKEYNDHAKFYSNQNDEQNVLFLKFYFINIIHVKNVFI